MRTTIIRTLIGSAAIFALSILCIASLYIYKMVVPTQVDANTINITQATVSQARTLWESQNLKEYEYTVDFDRPDLVITLRVNRVTGEYKYMKILSSDHEVPPGTPRFEALASCCEWTAVDNMYARAEQEIANQVANPHRATDTDIRDNYNDVVVQFDAQLGYPTEFSHYTRTTRNNREVTWRDSTQYIRVKDFKVISR